MTTEATPLLTEAQVLEYVREHGLELKPRKPPSDWVPRGRLNEVIAQREEFRGRVAELEGFVFVLQEALRLVQQRQALSEAAE